MIKYQVYYTEANKNKKSKKFFERYHAEKWIKDNNIEDAKVIVINNR